MTSPVDLINQALDQIGATISIQGINPPVPANNIAAAAAGRLYQSKVDAVMRSAHWNCLRKQATLSLLKSAAGTPTNASGTGPIPPVPYLYSYEIPADCLKVRFVIPQALNDPTVPALMTNTGLQQFGLVNTAMPFTTAVDTDASGNPAKVILTNAQNALVVYTQRITDPDFWDASLANAVIATLAAWLVNPVARNKDLLQERIAIAAQLVMDARISDGNESTTSIDHVPDFMRARQYGGAWGNWAAGFSTDGLIAAWDPLGMPNGSAI